MAEYDRLALLDSEMNEAVQLKRMLPFRDWYAVKAIHSEARYFDTKRKALAYARKHRPDVRVYRVGA